KQKKAELHKSTKASICRAKKRLKGFEPSTFCMAIITAYEKPATPKVADLQLLYQLAQCCADMMMRGDMSGYEGIRALPARSARCSWAGSNRPLRGGGLRDLGAQGRDPALSRKIQQVRAERRNFGLVAAAEYAPGIRVMQRRRRL